MDIIVSSPNKEVIIGDNKRTVIIGERINPTGKKKLQEALKENNLEIIRQEALAQVDAGADILDINVGTVGVDEVTMLPKVIELVTQTVNTPLCFDSANPAALAAALKAYNGKPLVNSVSGEDLSLDNVLPLVKDYRTAVIGLLQDNEGIPKTTERKIDIARKIVERADAIGINRNDIIIDCMVFSLAADTKSGVEVIDTIKKIKAELGVSLTMGASNISFGLPARSVINNTFIAFAIANGVNCLIADADKIRAAVSAADLILGRDNYAKHYIEVYRKILKNNS
jgi:5-methyltetrahydrofolate--homocysteine methyltransferase